MVQAIRAVQEAEGVPGSGIANIATQNAIDRRIRIMDIEDPNHWVVTDSTVDDELTLDDMTDVDALLAASEDDAGEDDWADEDLLDESDPGDLTDDSAPEWIGENR